MYEYTMKGGRCNPNRSKQGVDDATAHSSTSTEALASQHGELRSGETRAYLIRQQLSEPSVAI